MSGSLNYRVMCDDCNLECDIIGYAFTCPKCKKEWWVDG